MKVFIDQVEAKLKSLKWDFERKTPTKLVCNSDDFVFSVEHFGSKIAWHYVSRENSVVEKDFHTEALTKGLVQKIYNTLLNIS